MKKVLLFTINYFLLFFLANSQEQLKLKIYNSLTEPIFTTSNFKTVAVDKEGVIWAGSQYGGLYVYHPATQDWSKSSYLTNVFINDIKVDPASGIYIAQSGTSGSAAGEGNRQGGVVRFKNSKFEDYIYLSVNGTGSKSNGGLNSRMARSIWIDTNSVNKIAGRPKLWVTQNSFLTGGATSPGGIAIGENPPGQWFFAKKIKGLQIFPYTNAVSSGTPSVDAVCGNQSEVWVSVRTNYGGSEILKYSAQGQTFLGGYGPNGEFGNARRYYSNDTQAIVNKSTAGILRAGFRINAMYCDSDNRRWLGTASSSGGLILVENNNWSILNLTNLLPESFAVNNNAIAEDEYGNIYFGTTNGLLVLQANSSPQFIQSFKLYTTANGLPSNNINGIAYDSLKKEVIIATDNGVAIWNIMKPIDISLDWDFSFPKPYSNPKGVAADGVSRVYIKVKRNSDTIPPIKQVVLNIKNVRSGIESASGRLKVAIIENTYSDEASNASLLSATDLESNSKGEFVFWYKSPEDFNTGFSDLYTNVSERFEEFDVFVYYNTIDNRIDTINYKLKIVRPPVVFVHGLASNPACWDGLNDTYNGTLLKDSKIFKYTKALTMNGQGAIRENAFRLLGVSSNIPDIKTNSLQWVIDQLRIMGYASNQVDYVSHSMGGMTIRHAADEYKNLFYTNSASSYYNNYDSGYVHKYITLNTPHNSSPLADLVYDIAPNMNMHSKFYLSHLYELAPTAQIPFDFMRPTGFNYDERYWIQYPSDFEATNAIINLQIRDKTGGTNLKNTRFKNHLIVGEMGESYRLLLDKATNFLYNADLVVKAASLTKYGDYAIFLQTIITEFGYEMFRDYAYLYKAEAPEKFQDFVFVPNDIPIATKIAYFINWYSRRFGIEQYLNKSDVIVPIKSQLANQSNTLPNISFFNSTPGTADAMHTSITTRNDVGTKVKELLNAKRSNNSQFADIIPANNDVDLEKTYLPGQVTNPLLKSQPQQNNTMGIYQHFNKNKISISNASEIRNVNVDQEYTLRLNLNDSADLAYFKVRAGDTPVYVTKGFNRQEFKFTIHNRASGLGFITVSAVYDKPDGVHYYIDTLFPQITNSKPVKGFRIIEDEGVASETFRPNLEALIDTNWYRVPLSSPELSITIEDPSIITFVDTALQFVALNSGVTIATITYKGFSDEISLIAQKIPEPECFNKTVKTGNFNDPTVWSKNRVPQACDSIVINHDIIINVPFNVKALSINPNVKVTVLPNIKDIKIGALYQNRKPDNTLLFLRKKYLQVPRKATVS
ncbi:alpha/beta hydrolase [Polluticaenibacter yanchengensis]|uniref:DUF676 domain-containing protein n=1 Tax=Polluticaenibacter yanchengensis TaxID=3014562 RepID=A0ABT4UGX2_9BACT|nr:hypothetical protein [Chitinophagaceae bacterium LY-5]